MAATEAGRAAARAIDDLYRAHASEVYRYALAVLGDRADAEDVTQTTFLNAFRSLEQGVRPRKPSNWLLTIASNLIKQRFRREGSRPRDAVLDDRIADSVSDDAGPTIGELLAALAQIPPLQRQAIVLREFEGRSYKEIAEILDVTTSALETLLFRARRSLADELENQLTCTEAQFALSRAADGRIGRKERRRLRGHLEECPDCARFAQVQQRHRRALRGLALVPIPVSVTLFRALDGPAAAATLPTAGAGFTAAASGSVAGAATVAGGGVFAGSVALKAAAVVTAASVAGGVGVVGAAEVDRKDKGKAPLRAERPEQRLGNVAPRGVTVPGRGLAVGKPGAKEWPERRIGPVAPRAGKASATGRTTARENRSVRSIAPKAVSKRRSDEAKTKNLGKKAPVTPPANAANPRARGSERDTPTHGSPVRSRRGAAAIADRATAETYRDRSRATSAGAP